MKTISVSGRAYALDALRGYAIVTMVLSDMVAGGILPAWMYHTQTPPPGHVYNPTLTGLTWVDMVFPFFLFAMGAAFPFSIKGKYEKGSSRKNLVYQAVKRGFQLTFFAIFIQHFYPYMLDNPQNAHSWLLAILCFAILFPMFMRIPYGLNFKVKKVIKFSAFGIAVLMMFIFKDTDGSSVNLFSSNIIILLLANMAIWGSLLYILTMGHPEKRILFLALLMAFILSAATDGSWIKSIFHWSPLPWMFKFDYLKYLFVIVPGSLAGEILKESTSLPDKNYVKTKNSESDRLALQSIVLSILPVMIIIGNLYGLYTHSSALNFTFTLFMLVIGLIVLKRSTGIGSVWRKLFCYGAYFLLLGLLFEPFQGGIKKDPATFSYLFVTSGLAFMALIFFSVLCDFFKWRRSTDFLVKCGQNPMIAYVAGDLLILPLLNLSGIFPKIITFFSRSPFLGFLQGIFLTSLSILVTVFFSRIKWFWRT